MVFGIFNTGINKGKAQATSNAAATAYDFSFTYLMEDKPLALADFKGQVMLVVNTASECGFTGQYSGLQMLYDRYRERGLVIIGVPSNDFGSQEPGSAKDIAHFCSLNYGVTFPMSAKEHVKGDKAHPFYQWAHDILGFGSAPKWNFHKYLIGRDGKIIDHYYPTTTPEDTDLHHAIEKALDVQL